MERLAVLLDMTPAQKQQVQTIFSAERDQMKQAMKQAMEAAQSRAYRGRDEAGSGVEPDPDEEAQAAHAAPPSSLHQACADTWACMGPMGMDGPMGMAPMGMRQRHGSATAAASGGGSQ